MAFLIDQFTGSPAAPHRRAAADAFSALKPAGSLAGSRRVLLGLARECRSKPAFRASLMAVAGGAALLCALVGADALFAARQAEAAGAATPAPQAWSEVIRPMPIYDLGGTDFVKLARTYQAWRHVPDGTREDVMSFGTLGDAKPYLRIALQRRRERAPEPEAAPLVDALARGATAADGTATQFRPLPPVETRFGTLEQADFKLWRRGTDAACRGFRGLPNGGDVLRLVGFACGGAGQPVAENAVACAVDRIDLLSAGDDRPLRILFVAAERRPGAAACREGVLAASMAPAMSKGPFASLRRRAAWLDAGQGRPALRGPLDATYGER